MEDPRSAAFRIKIFDWLQERMVAKGDVLSREELRAWVEKTDNLTTSGRFWLTR